MKAHTDDPELIDVQAEQRKLEPEPVAVDTWCWLCGVSVKNTLALYPLCVACDGVVEPW